MISVGERAQNRRKLSRALSPKLIPSSSRALTGRTSRTHDVPCLPSRSPASRQSPMEMQCSSCLVPAWRGTTRPAQIWMLSATISPAAMGTQRCTMGSLQPTICSTAEDLGKASDSRCPCDTTASERGGRVGAQARGKRAAAGLEGIIWWCCRIMLVLDRQ